MLAIHRNHESLQLLRKCYSCLNLQQQQQKLMLRSRHICSRNSNPPLILPHRSVPPFRSKVFVPRRLCSSWPRQYRRPYYHNPCIGCPWR